MLTLNEVIENATQLPAEQQEILLEVLYRRQMEFRRNEIATDAQRSLMDFCKGKLAAKSLTSVLNELHEALDEQDNDK